MHVCFLCVCSPPSYEKTFTLNEAIINQTSPTSFQFLMMTLVINVIDERGFSNKAHLTYMALSFTYVDGKASTSFHGNYTTCTV